MNDSLSFIKDKFIQINNLVNNTEPDCTEEELTKVLREIQQIVMEGHGYILGLQQQIMDLA